MTECDLCGVDLMFHIKDRFGYILVLTPRNHPRRQFGDLIHEHILVAERKLLGRYLKEGESIHHVNKIRNDNRPMNLSVMQNDDDHAYIHKHDKKIIRKGMDDKGYDYFI